MPLARVLLLSLVLALASCGKSSTTFTGPWESLPLGTSANLGVVTFSDAKNGWVAGGGYNIDGGLLGRTSDGGRTWTYTSGLSYGRNAIMDLAWLDTNNGVMASSSGTILRTDDGGRTWKNVGGIKGTLTALSFIDAQNGWAASQNEVRRTEDGGWKWQTVTVPGERVDATAMQFLDADTGWIASRDGKLRYTTDGGATWTAATLPLAADERPQFRSLHFIDGQHGWAVGEQGLILRTVDGGDTWSRHESGLPDARSVSRPEKIPQGGKIVEFDTGDRTPGLTLTAVRFKDRDVGYAAGYYANEGRSLILRSQDGGFTWTVDAKIDGEDLRALSLSGGAAWAVGSRTREVKQALYRRAP